MSSCQTVITRKSRNIQSLEDFYDHFNFELKFVCLVFFPSNSRSDHLLICFCSGPGGHLVTILPFVAQMNSLGVVDRVSAEQQESFERQC